MISEIKSEAKRLGIERLCHFTPSRNLVHIASGKLGVLATANLKADERNVYTPTDLRRLDGHVGYISCSVQYPNAWYFDKARSAGTLFKDWVIMLIDPRHLWVKGTRFCPRNAAGAGGRQVSEGASAFLGLFEDSVLGAYGNAYIRSAKHLPCCPTDEQAEVLVPDAIPLQDVLGVVVSSDTQARNELARFRHLQIRADQFPIIVSPTLFDKRALSRCIRSGSRPAETIWNGGGRGR